MIDGAGRFGAAEVSAASWIVQRPAPMRLPAPLPRALGAGELEAIALAWQHPSVPVLLDDRDGRRYAEALELRVYGSAGVLIEAKQLDLLPAVTGPLQRLIAAGLRVSPRVYADLIAAAGEPER